MFTPLRTLASEPEGKVLVGSAAAVLTVGTIAYTVLEGWSPLDALYFCVVTLATVGFGDLTPTTDAAKLFTIGYIITGVGILAAFASELTKHRQASRAMARPVEVVTEVAEKVEEDVARIAEGESPRTSPSSSGTTEDR
jgi:hypothetical protein